MKSNNKIIKIALIIAILSVLYCTICQSAEITLTWQASEGAIGYRLYRSFDAGASWEQPLDVGNVTTVVLPDENGELILYKASAYNLLGEVVNNRAGAWYNSTTLTAPSMLGIR